MSSYVREQTTQISCIADLPFNNSDYSMTNKVHDTTLMLLVFLYKP